MEGILSNLRVLDFSRVLSGPFATRILADFGAEVIKVQSTIVNKTESHFNGYFDLWNRNKRSILLNMNHPESYEIAMRLVAICDVVIENFSPRVMKNWRMDFQTLKSIKPDLIMLSMSGMGQTGPWRNYVAFGPTVHSLGGLAHLTSFNEDSPLGPGYAFADHISGLYGVFVILSALEKRDRIGEGQYIDLAQYEVVVSQIGPALLDMLNNNYNRMPSGNQPDYEIAAPHGCYRCLGKDQWCVIGVFNENEWKALVQVTGKHNWATDLRFCNLAKRKDHFLELDEELNKWTSTHTASEVVELLQSAGVPSGIVQNAEEMATDKQLLEREFFIQIEHPLFGKIMTDTSPLRSVADSPSFWDPKINLKFSPQLGEGNHYVYRELLGLTEQEYKSYCHKGVIA